MLLYGANISSKSTSRYFLFCHICDILKMENFGWMLVLHIYGFSLQMIYWLYCMSQENEPVNLLILFHNTGSLMWILKEIYLMSKSFPHFNVSLLYDTIA